MEQVGKSTGKLRLVVSRTERRFIEVKSPTGRAIGHIINGGSRGPNLVIAGVGTDIQSVFQALKAHPELDIIMGKLVLLDLESLGTAETQAVLDNLAACILPISGTLFLDSDVLDAGERGSSPSRVLIDKVLDFCAKHGLNKPAAEALAPKIRDYAS